MTREAAKNDANIICFPELFNTNYFCTVEDNKPFDSAEPIPGPTTDQMARIAKETKMAIVAPLFEKVMYGEY